MNQIDMIKCFYCQKEFTTVEDELCNKCKPQFEIDMVLIDLFTKIKELEQFDKNILKNRYKILKRNKALLDNLIKQLDTGDTNEDTRRNSSTT